MGEDIMKKYSNIKSIILPSRKINIFVVGILFLGIILGSIFMCMINMNDRLLVIEKIKLFIDNINNSRLDSLLLLKNSISINLLYVFIIWILGLSLIGIIINIFLFFFKSFIFGFTLASFIITYKYKGILLSLLYLLFGELLNIIILLVITIYSIMISYRLITLIFRGNNIGIKKYLRNYLLILVISIILSIISSLFESFLLPSLIKLVIGLYV